MEVRLRDGSGIARQLSVEELRELVTPRPTLERWPSAEELADGLFQLYDTQQQVSSRVPGCVPEPGERPTKEAVATYGHALQHEVGELMDELGWSPWKDTAPVDKARTLDELADVLAFLGVVLIHVRWATGATMEEVAEAYVRKTATNVERLEGKVDGYRQNGERGDDASKAL